MTDEIASAALQRLLGINKSVLAELGQRGIVQRGTKRGSYALQESERLLRASSRAGRRSGRRSRR